jgi:major membrane immunogen (membrane-anchored lipoprotein)
MLMFKLKKTSNRRIQVKKTAVVILAMVTLAAMGCTKKEDTSKATAPKGGMPAAVPGGAPGVDPHAGLKPQEIPAGAGHKGKVVSTMNAGGYTYVEVEENGQKLWVAVMETKVNAGDVVEFPDSPPMVNFQSKSLKRTFDKIIFAPGLRISK